MLMNHIGGLVFFGTPHRGSNLSKLAQIAIQIAKSTWKFPSKSLLGSLEGNTLFANELVHQFRELLSTFPVVSCFETRKTSHLGIVRVRGLDHAANGSGWKHD